jgi:hypothetical protein
MSGQRHEYVAQVIKPAYLALVEAHGGPHSQSWKQKAKDLVAEHTKRKTDGARKIAINAAELGSQMKSLNKRWTDDVKWGARLNMHIMYIIISGNPDLAASRHNTMVCGTAAMQKWCKAELPVATSLLPKIHSYIVAEGGLTGIRPTQAPKQMPNDMHAKRAACTAELTRLFEEHSGTEVRSKFPWGTIPAFLIRHRLRIDNWPPSPEFPDILEVKVGSVRMEQWTNLWKRLFATDDARRLTVKQLEVPDDQDLPPTTCIVRCSNDMLLLVADWDDKVAKEKPHSEGEAGSLGKQIVEGGSAGGNPSKRRKKQDAKNGAKRRKVLSNPIIEDDNPESSLAHSSTPLPPPPPLSVPLPMSVPLPPNSISGAMGTSDLASMMSNESLATTPSLDFMDPTGFNFSTLNLDFSQFPDLVVSEHQDLLQRAQHSATL